MKNIYTVVGTLAILQVISVIPYSFTMAAQDPEFDRMDLGFECVIEPRTKAQVGSPTSGLVEVIFVKRGDQVVKGQALARLESSLQIVALELAKLNAEDEVDLESRKTLLKLEREKTKRIQKLYETKVVSDAAVDEAKAAEELAELDLKAAEVEQRRKGVILKQAQSEIALRTVRSPIDGIVTNRMMSPGEFAHEQSPILEIAEIDPLYVESFLPIDLYESINKNTTAIIHPAQPVGGNFEAVITVVDQVFDAASGTFGVRMQLDNKDGKLPAGVPCRVTFNR
jgi:RND family efflux transporter MFP subunit